MSAGRVVTIILAAGASTRLGRPKQLVPVHGVPLVARAVRTSLEAGLGPVIVVLGAESDAVAAALPESGVTIVRNERWSAGVGTSIAAGVEVAGRDPSCDAVILMTCDQPGVTAAHLQALAQISHRHGAATVGSAYGGTIGIPALFARARFPELAVLQPDSGAKALLSGAPSVPCAACEADVDVPSDVPPT